MKIKNIALAGNPNAGKTTIFNNLTGANQKTGNYPGVTVEKRMGSAKHEGYSFNIVDLPGTYSLSATAEDEVVARNYIIKEHPEVIVNVLDASNMYRNLYLTLQLIELGRPIVMALNMVDTAKTMGITVSIERLKLHFPNVSVYEMIGSKNIGTKELLGGLTKELQPCTLHLTYGDLVETAATKILEILEPMNLPADFPKRWLSLRMLENKMDLCDLPEMPCMTAQMQEEMRVIREKLAEDLGEEVSVFISSQKYEYINHIINGTVLRSVDKKINTSDRIDEILTHKYLGLPIFMFLMWLLFNAVFTLGAYPQGWLEDGIAAFSGYLGGVMEDGVFKDLLIDGIIGGVGGVISFLPNILLLFLGISLMEGTGYMSRAAFLMDRVMLAVGLHGKSFIPLLIGFGCTVPAVMGTRTLENKNDRLVTVLVSPFMSCSARLPVYTLLIGAFFEEAWAGTVLFGVYLFGIVTAIVLAKIFRKTMFPGNTEPFIMEMPPYRIPTLKNVILQMMERAMLYVKKAGTVILAASILIWVMTTYPKDVEYTKDYPTMITQLQEQLEQLEGTEEGADKAPAQAESKPVATEAKAEVAKVESTPTETAKAETAVAQVDKKASADAESGEDFKAKLEEKIAELERAQKAEALEQSYAGMIGKKLEPVMDPLGFNWKVSVSLLAAFSAKEVLVSSLGTIYSVGADDDSTEALTSILQEDPTLSPLIAISLMVFTLLYTPCLATIAIIYRETGGWKWPIFTGVYSLVLAWVMSFVITNVGHMLGF